MSGVKLGKGGAKIRNVPIAVTPEGFWCCPSPVVFQKTLKTQPPLNKSKPPPTSPPPPPPPPPSSGSINKKQSHSNEKKPSSPNPAKTASLDDQKSVSNSTPPSNVGLGGERTSSRNKGESLPKKVSIEFGESGTSDMKVVLYGKHGFSVKLNVHKEVLVENSSFFGERLAEQESDVASLQILDCEDVEIYVEAVGLMYSKDVKQRLLKQSVQRVLRILKVAEVIGFNACIKACLDYLEAAPWVGEEEEEKVVSSVMRVTALE